MDNNWETHPIFNEVVPRVFTKFKRFHALNPQVWELIKKFAYEAKNSGRKRYGMQGIGERIRWHVEIETRGDIFKINNDYLACYSRLLKVVDPSFNGFLQTRTHTCLKEE